MPVFFSTVQYNTVQYKGICKVPLYAVGQEQ